MANMEDSALHTVVYFGDNLVLVELVRELLRAQQLCEGFFLFLLVRKVHVASLLSRHVSLQGIERALFVTVVNIDGLG